MKKNYCVFTLICLTPFLYSIQSTAQLVRLSQGFDNYIGSAATVPAGWYISWNSTSAPSYYFTTGNYGAAIPSYKFGNNGDEIISPYFLSGDTLRFWYKGQGVFSAQNSLSILYSSDSTTWNILVNPDTLLVTGTTFSYPLPCEAHYLMFIYHQVSGNLAFDDVRVTMTDYSPIAIAAVPAIPLCAGDTGCFANASIIAGCDSIISHVWDFGDGTPTDSSENPCHTFSLFGTYIVKLFITASNGNSDSTFVVINIHFVPGVHFSANNSSGTLVDFTDLSAGIIVSWLWNFGDSTLSIQQNPSHAYPSIGTYFTCLTVTSDYGCQSTACDSVDVIGAGIEEDVSKSLAISVAPNPAKDKLYVLCHTLYGNEKIELFNSIGVNVLKSGISSQESEIDISTLPAGVYFLKVMTRQRSATLKVLIAN